MVDSNNLKPSVAMEEAFERWYGIFRQGSTLGTHHNIKELMEETFYAGWRARKFAEYSRRYGIKIKSA